jgi:hypothetical protein
MTLGPTQLPGQCALDALSLRVTGAYNGLYISIYGNAKTKNTKSGVVLKKLTN